jgi:hypothetical protein
MQKKNWKYSSQNIVHLQTNCPEGT